MLKLLTFAEDTLTTVNDSQFVKARLRCFADGVTSHGWKFSLDAIKASSETLFGKPVLWAYNVFFDDADAHEDDEIPCGFIPESADSADVQYVYDENYNKTFLETNCYIWKVYAEKLVEILTKTKGIKDVSAELWVLAQDENDEQNITSYCYTGVTILGEHVDPAVKGANIKVIKFSEDFEKAKNEFMKELENSEEGGKIMDNDKIQQLNNSTEHKTVRVSVSESISKYDDKGNYVGNEYEAHTKETSTIQEVDDEPVVAVNNDCGGSDGVVKDDNACDDAPVQVNNAEETVTECNYEELYNSAQEQIVTLTKELDTLKNSYATLEIKCSELTEYKLNREADEMKKAVDCALNEVSDVFSADEIEEWRTKAVKCSNLDAFKNELKASAYDKQKKQTPSIRNPIPMDFAQKDDANATLWERVAKEINNK